MVEFSHLTYQINRMTPVNNGKGIESELLDYVLGQAREPGTRLPSIRDLSRQFGISPAKLREQLQVARALGIVDVRPKTGIRTREFSYLPSVRLAVLLALTQDPRRFEDIRLLRIHLEEAFWSEAVSLLSPSDIDELERLVRRAWERLRGDPVQIPHAEHKALHLTVFSRLPNPLVRALLETYWEAYEAVGLSLYTDYAYLHEVWTYHEAMVRALRRGDLEAGKRALIEHTALLRARPLPAGEPLMPSHSSEHQWKGDLR
jgi:DNA-binding FadR family transcriptional regulator